MQNSVWVKKERNSSDENDKHDEMKLALMMMMMGLCSELHRGGKS